MRNWYSKITIAVASSAVIYIELYSNCALENIVHFTETTPLVSGMECDVRKWETRIHLTVSSGSVIYIYIYILIVLASI